MSLDPLSLTLILPALAAAVLAFTPGYRLSAGINLAASAATFLAAAALLVVDRPAPGDYLHIDDLNIVFI
ncbi:MAG: hydrogenase 4 subunit F, partial [Alphaproteobacteria bacterium]